MAESTGKAEYFVGLDLGGTKILAGVFKHSLECIGTAKLSTKPQRGVEPVIERVARCIQDAVDEADLSLKQVAGVGIGAPCPGDWRGDQCRISGAGFFRRLSRRLGTDARRSARPHRASGDHRPRRCGAR